MFEIYGDKTIPGAVECLSLNDAEETEQSLNVENLELEENLMTKSDEVENSDDEIQENTSVYNVAPADITSVYQCTVCGTTEECCTIQSELKKFQQREDVCLDTSYRCV